MPSRNSKQNANDDLDQKKKLQAVVLADSFLTTFKPLSLDTPKVLCPLNNISMLDYAMDFLASNHVEEVILVCTSDQLEIPKKWGGRMDVECLKDSSLTNAGDALRELYKRNLVQSDPFILLFGDVITNMDLRRAMEAHEVRHAQDSAAIMTLVLNPASATPGGIRPATSDLVVGLDSTKENRVLLYDDHANSNSVKVPCSFMASHMEVELRTDLVDTGVFICSPDVLGRFEDEFDYLDIAGDFVANCVAEEEEGLQTRIHAHILGDGEYAARVSDLATYHVVSQDLLQRWCYPMVADNLHSTPERYKLTQSSSTNGALYNYRDMSKPAKIARSSHLQGAGIMGSRCLIADQATVVSSVLGHSVSVGANAKVENSHLWDNVVVEENATISHGIVAQNAIIREGAVVSRGCVIGQGCIIGKGVVLPEFTRITLQTEDDPFGGDDGGFDDFESVPNHIHDADTPAMSAEVDTSPLVGPDGKGHVWVPIDENDDDSVDDADLEFSTSKVDPLLLQSMGYDAVEYFNQRFQRQVKEEQDVYSDKGRDELEAERMETEAFSAYTEGAFTFEDTAGSAAATSSAGVVFGRQKGVDVVKELKEICLEFEETSPMENLAIELNSYKFSQNATYADCTMGTTLAILEKMNITPDMSDGKLVAGLKQRLEFWAPLLQKMSIGQEEEKAIIMGLERAATTEGDVLAEKLSSGNSMRFLLQTMHDEEVLSEEAILSWAEDRKQETRDSPLGKLFALPSIREFLEWLEESEDEDSEDEDSD